MGVKVDMINEAKRLLYLGLPLIPLCPPDHGYMSSNHKQKCACPGKVPLIANWTNHGETTEADLQKWLTDFKKFNIGLPLGSISGYVGIDIDGSKGEELLKQLSLGDIPETWEFKTAAGRRLLYLVPEGLRTKKFKKSGDGNHEECAILCSGQQTVMPPSVHNSGFQYIWETGKSPWDIDCIYAPQWLIELIEDKSEYNKGFTLDLNNIDAQGNNSLDLDDEFQSASFQADVEVSDSGKRETKGKIVVDDYLLTHDIPEGQRDNTMTAIAGHYCANRDLRLLGRDMILNICLQHNQRFCKPPLADEAVAQKVNYFFEIEKGKDAKFKDKKGKGQGKDFLPTKLAAIVRNKLRDQGILIHFDLHSKMYYYTNPTQGPWICTRNIPLINKWIRKIITEAPHGDPSWDKINNVNEVRTALEESYMDAYKFFDDFDLGEHTHELSKYIVVSNGMLDWQEGILKPWSPEYFTTIAFDITYDKDATCPNFERYLADWLPDPDVRKVVQEFIGYCLIPNTHFRKALFLYGKGMNGKSMFLEFLQRFFTKHLSTLSYDNLFSRFGPAKLKDKLVNIYDDTTVSFSKETSNLKNMIAGGRLEAEFKGKDMFSFTNVARMIFSSQETPRTTDMSDAWQGRWFFVKFPNRFKPSNQAKVQIQNHMEEELSGIFNWMLEGLQRLMAQDGFTYSESLAGTSQEYRNLNNNVSSFIDTMCVSAKEDKKVTCALNTLYKIYCTWSEYEGLRPLSKKIFAERVEDLGYLRSKGYAKGKSGVTVMIGLDIDRDCEEYQENKLDYAIALQSS